MATTTATRILAPVGTAGKLFAFGLDVGRGLFRRPFQTREFIQQAWFIASVTIASRTAGSSCTPPGSFESSNAGLAPGA